MSSENYFIKDQNAPYFLTFTVVDWVDVFTRSQYKNTIVDSLNYCIHNKGLTIFAWCLMSNHLHLVARAEENFNMSDIIRDFKKFTAKKITELISEEPESRREWMLYRFMYAGKFDHRIKNYKFWQETSHPILLDNNQLIDQKISYIHQNPVRSSIVHEPEDYIFSSACDYAGTKGLVDIESIV
ncbi:MAG: transposase [Prolixibacteraceae bacterium]|nr:transposase [Prolixibacteraceae bacterium]